MPPKTPYDTNALIKQTQNMLAQTKSQGSTAFAGSTYDTNRVGAVQAITPSAMTPAQPVTPVVTPQTPAPEISGLNADIAGLFEPTAQEQQYGQSSDIIKQLTSSLSGEETRRQELEQQGGVSQQRQMVQDLSSQLKAIQAEQQAIPLQVQQDIQAGGANVTKGGVAPIQTAQLRNNAIRALSVGAQLEASRGNLSLALDLVDRAVKAEFDPIRSKLNAELQNIDLLLKDPTLTLAQQKRAEQLKAVKEAEKERIASAEQEKTDIYDMGIKALQLGADALTVKAIQGAKTRQEAAQIVAQSGLMAPTAGKRETQVVKLDNGSQVLLDTQTGQVIRTLSGSGTVPTGSSVVTTTGGQSVAISPDAQQWVDAINSGSVSLDDALTKIGSTAKSLGLKNEIIAGINAQGGQTETKLTQMKNNVSLIDEILSGDFEYFGASVAPRSVFGFKVNPYFNSFKAKVDNLVASLTVDNLGLLKGPMSDKDIEFVKQLSSGLDLSMDEKTAKTRLEQIKARMNEKLQNASPAGVGTASVLRSPDGTQEIDISSLSPQELQEAKNAGWK